MNCHLREKQIDLEEYRTTYLEGGEAPSSDPILFLHGWTTSTAPYRESLSLLCQRYRVIAPDLPGFGKSTHPKCVPDHVSYVNCIVSFLQALNIQKVHVIGHSGGVSDRLIPLRLGYEFSQCIPGDRMIVAQGEYHEWAMFRPERFVPIIFDFLSAVEKSSSVRSTCAGTED